MKPTKKKSLAFDLRRILFEDESKPQSQGAMINPLKPSPLPQEVQNLSLDMKVDAYFMKYETDSMPTQGNYDLPGSTTVFPDSLSESFGKTFAALLEAEDDALGGADASAPPDTSGVAPEGEGGAAQSAAGPPTIENPRFNVSNFAQGVARLVMNYESLLDPKTTILNRAKAYIAKNYDAGLAEQLMDILQRQFNLEPKTLDVGVEMPKAAGAWTGVGGGS